MLASTIASTVVGTWTKGMPRRKVAAAKPVRSPTIAAAERDERAVAVGAVPQQRPVEALDLRRFFVASPSGTSSVRTATPARRSDASSGAA